MSERRCLQQLCGRTPGALGDSHHGGRLPQTWKPGATVFSTCTGRVRSEAGLPGNSTMHLMFSVSSVTRGPDMHPSAAPCPMRGPNTTCKAHVSFLLWEIRFNDHGVSQPNHGLSFLSYSPSLSFSTGLATPLCPPSRWLLSWVGLSILQPFSLQGHPTRTSKHCPGARSVLPSP